MSKINSVILGLSLLCMSVGCTSDTTKTESLSYQFNVNGCDTEKHTLANLEAYCNALKDSALNNGCAADLRYSAFQNKCSGYTWPVDEIPKPDPTVTPTPTPTVTPNPTPTPTFSSEDWAALRHQLEPYQEEYAPEFRRAEGLQRFDYSTIKFQNLDEKECLDVQSQIIRQYSTNPFGYKFGREPIVPINFCKSYNGVNTSQIANYRGFNQLNVQSHSVLNVMAIQDGIMRLVYMMLDTQYKIIEIQYSIGQRTSGIMAISTNGSLYVSQRNYQDHSRKFIHIPADMLGSIPYLSKKVDFRARTIWSLSRTDLQNWDEFVVLPTTASSLYLFGKKWSQTPTIYRSLTIGKDDSGEPFCMSGRIQRYDEKGDINVLTDSTGEGCETR